jgi:hypothetical protein
VDSWLALQLIDRQQRPVFDPVVHFPAGRQGDQGLNPREQSVLTKDQASAVAGQLVADAESKSSKKRSPASRFAQESHLLASQLRDFKELVDEAERQWLHSAQAQHGAAWIGRRTHNRLRA